MVGEAYMKKLFSLKMLEGTGVIKAPLTRGVGQG